MFTMIFSIFSHISKRSTVWTSEAVKFNIPNKYFIQITLSQECLACNYGIHWSHDWWLGWLVKLLGGFHATARANRLVSGSVSQPLTYRSLWQIALRQNLSLLPSLVCQRHDFRRNEIILYTETMVLRSLCNIIFQCPGSTLYSLNIIHKYKTSTFTLYKSLNVIIFI